MQVPHTTQQCSAHRAVAEDLPDKQPAFASSIASIPMDFISEEKVYRNMSDVPVNRDSFKLPLSSYKLHQLAI